MGNSRIFLIPDLYHILLQKQTPSKSRNPLKWPQLTWAQANKL